MTASAPATNPSPDPTKVVSLTNNSGKSAVVIIPAATASEGTTSYTAISNSNLLLLNSTAGTPAVANGSTASFVLDQYFTDSTTGGQDYNCAYNLVVSDAGTWFPLSNIGLVQDFLANPPSYPAQTVAVSDAKSLTDAALFWQTIQALPTSQLAQNYNTALNGSSTAGTAAADGSANSSQNVANAMTGTVDDFFKTTKQFTDVTYADVIAVQDYYTNFPIFWGGSSNQTYYLYGTSGSGTSATTVFVGSIAFTTPANLDPTADNLGYGCVFSPATNPTDTTRVDVDSTKQKSLVYSNGLFVDDANADTPDIAVKGAFHLLSTFTNNPSDNSVVTVLTGTVGGTTCLGFDKPQSSADQSNSQFWYALFHPQTGAQIFQSIMTIGGALMMLQFVGSAIWSTIKWARSLGAAKQPTTAELLAKQQADLQASFNKSLEQAVQKLSGGRQQPPSDVNAANKAISDSVGVVSDNVNVSRAQSLIDAQKASLETLAKFEGQMSPTELQQFQTAANNLRNAETSLQSASPDQLGNVVDSVTKQITDIQGNIGDLATSMSTRLAQAENQALEANKAAVEEGVNDINESNAQGEGGGEGEPEIKPLFDDVPMPGTVG